MNNPTVSIIMSTYNDAQYIDKAIDSVLKQTFTNWEFIIINDASTDVSDKIIKEYAKKDKRFIYIVNDENKGQTINLNKEVKLAKGKFIARLDADDIWADKDKLKKQFDFLTNHSEYGLVGCFWNIIDDKGRDITQVKYPTNDEDIRNYLLIENCFAHSAVLIRKKILDKIGNYNINYEYAQDYDLWLRIGTISKFYNYPEFMVKYRINPNGMSQTNYKQVLKNTFGIIKENKKKYPNFTKAYVLWQLRRYIPNNKRILELKTIFRRFIFGDSKN